MCKNNFTNENEFDFKFDFSDISAVIPGWERPDEVCNPSGLVHLL